MSRPRYWWYGVVRKSITHARELETDTNVQAIIISNAIKDAKEETKKLPNGDLRIRAVEEILINKTKTYEGVALEVHYDWRTVQNWVNSFVNLVGKKAGY